MRFLFVALALSAASLSRGAVVNGGFESGSTGWTETGGSGNFTTPGSLTGFYHTVSAASGLGLGVISNDGLAFGELTQSFALPADAGTLSFSYLFQTDAFNDPAFNDTATVTLTPAGGSPVTLLTVSRDDLQALGDGPLLPGAVYFDFQTISQDTWRTFSADVSSLAGQTVTLSFRVDNAGDPDALLSSRLAVDDVNVAAVPETSTGLLSLLATGLLTGMRRRK